MYNEGIRKMFEKNKKRWRSDEGRHKNCIFAASKAAIAQLVERQLPKLQVAGSRPVCRSEKKGAWKRGSFLFNIVSVLCIANFKMRGDGGVVDDAANHVGDEFSDGEHFKLFGGAFQRDGVGNHHFVNGRSLQSFQGIS